MGDILLSEEQVKLLDETGSIYPAPNTVVPDDSIMDDIVYDGNNNVLTDAQRLELQAALNNGNPTPPSGGRIPNVH